MKKPLALMLAMAMALSFAACGDTDDDDDDDKDNKSAVAANNDDDTGIAEDLLKTANGNAKTVFTRLNYDIADMVVAGKLSEITIGSVGPVAFADLDQSDPVQQKLFESLKDNDLSGGYIYYEVNDKYAVTFTQWSQKKDSVVVGQYPDSPTSADDKVTLGEKFG